MRAPWDSTLLPAADAIVESARFDPPVPLLVTNDGGQAARTALAHALLQLRDSASGYECFPDTPGTLIEASVRSMPGAPVLEDSLVVSCTSGVVATPLELWRLTFTETWQRSVGRDEGRRITNVWLDATDKVLGWESGDDVPP